VVWKWPEALETGPGGLIELVLHAVWWGVGDMGGVTLDTQVERFRGV
jgi:hypothetical protein